MKSIQRWDDLREYGINALTGEADRTGMRLLCDLDDQGKRLVLTLLGIMDPDVKLEPNYNSGSKYSVMLPYTIFHDLAAFALLFGKDRCTEVSVINPTNKDGDMRSVHEVVGLERTDSASDWDEHTEFLRSAGFHVRVIKINDRQPGEADRATHAMSGRTY